LDIHNSQGVTPNPEEQAELTSLAYFLRQLDAMRERGLITPQAHATVKGEAEQRRTRIETDARYRDRLEKAVRLAPQDPRQALELAREARLLVPGRQDAWLTELALLRQLNRNEDALELGRSAANQFPELAVALADLASESKSISTSDRDLEILEGPASLDVAREAAKAGNDALAIASCTAWLETHHEDLEALVILAFSLRRVGRREESLECYRTLARLQPAQPAWSQWIKALESSARTAAVFREERRDSKAAKSVKDSPPETPGLSWSSVAGEFLEEHWQKLILCLAVLLIVVSSTLGAHRLLGPRLWSPAGKCALALVYTMMFTAFGSGLVRWGAERAGRMMLITTLIVVPINLMLAGEMRLLSRPDTSSMAVLALDIAALFLVTRRVASALHWRSGATPLAFSLLALSVVNVFEAYGVSRELGLAGLMVPPWIYLACVWWLNTRWGEPKEGEPQGFFDLALGLLTFAYLSSVARTALLMNPPPHASLFAVPVMLTAIAWAFTVGRQNLGEPVRKRERLWTFAGLILSGLALSLALLRPPGPSWYFSVNTLSTAALGLVLYLALLRWERQPAYLYMAFGAVFLAYFGSFDLIRPRIEAIEAALSLALGYAGRPLPLPFRALHALVFNVVLALLARFFSKGWGDARLARHCHYLGLPLSVCACVLSGFEPKAALICLTGYTLQYSAAIRLFDQPRLVYLACSALVGALWFALDLRGGWFLDHRAVVAVVLAFSFRALADEVARRGRSVSYQRPFVHMSLALGLGALVASGLSLWPTWSVSLAACLALFLTAWLFLWLLADFPASLVVVPMLASSLGAWLGGVAWLGGIPLQLTPIFGATTAGFALACLAACEWASARRSARAQRISAWFPLAVDVLVVLALVMSSAGGHAQAVQIAATLMLGGSALLWLTRFQVQQALVYLGALLIMGSQLVLGWGRLDWLDWLDVGIGLGALALIAAGEGLVLWRVGSLLRRGEAGAFYSPPCFNLAWATTWLVFGLAIFARLFSREAFPASALALLSNGLVLVLLALVWRSPTLTYQAVGSVVLATNLVLFSAEKSDPANAYIVGLVGVVQGILCWLLGQLAIRWSPLRPSLKPVLASPLFVSALGLTILAVPFSIPSSLSMVLIALSFLLTVKSFPSTVWLYAAIASLWCVLEQRYLRNLSREHLMIVSVAATHGLWALGMSIRRASSWICARIEVRPLPLSNPIFHVAILISYLALGFVFRPMLAGGPLLAGDAWVPLVLSLFWLLLIAPYPEAACVHVFVVLSTVGALLAVSPWVDTWGGWLFAGMTLAMWWLALGRNVLEFGPSVRRTFSNNDLRVGEIFEVWSALCCVASAGLAGWLVSGATFGVILLGDDSWYVLVRQGWPWVGGTLFLAWVYALLQRPVLGSGIVVIRALALTSLLWWVGLSPDLARLGFGPLTFDPPITALLSFGLVVLALWREADSKLDLSRGERVNEWLGLLLTLVACLLALQGRGAWASILALMISTLTLGMLAVRRHRLVAAYVGPAAWFLAIGALAKRILGPVLLAGGPSSPLPFAVGAMLAVYSTWAFSGWLGRTTVAATSKGGERRGRVVLGFERMALLGSLLTLMAVASREFPTLPAATTSPGLLSLAGTAILISLAGFYLLAARRWNAEWLVYAAQGTLLYTYADYRFGHPVSVSTDAAVLTLLGYLDLGISELMQRLRMNLYARPTLYVSLLLPLIPPVLAVVEGRFDELSLFWLLTTATFYAVACYTKQAKSLGYAAAILFNAVLWVAWSRIGWRLADHPQFFLIPVGFSTILLAEVNRREFGKDLVNAIRGLGLCLVYASLAFPIWNYQDFGSWLTLLLLSLVGIFVGIGLRVQTFLWLGLACFVLNVLYQVGRMSSENALARWGVMLTLGILLILFVALNEKKRIVATMRSYYDLARSWE